MYHCDFIVSQLFINIDVCEVLLKYYAMNYDFKNVVIINGGDFLDTNEQIPEDIHGKIK